MLTISDSSVQCLLVLRGIYTRPRKKQKVKNKYSLPLNKERSILSTKQLKRKITDPLVHTLNRASHGDFLSRWQVLERLRAIRLLRPLIPQFVTSKRILVHLAFLLLMSAIVWQSNAGTGIDQTSLLYSFISGEEVVEGPLDPSAYAQTDGVGGDRIAAIDASDANLITFDDPEVQFAETLGGNAVVAPLQPLVPEPGTSPETKRPKRSTIYTVAEGDTIASIAAKFDISENTVLWANGLSSNNIIKVGDHLTILPTTGVVHTVQSGDTVSEIARKYEVKGADIIAYNSLSEEANLSIGQKVIVPDGYIAPQQAPRIIPRSTRVAERDADDGPTPEPAPSVGSSFVWPTVSRHIAQYFRWGHTGIDIDNRSRPAIYAVSSGTVEFTGWLGGYGNLIIINHGGGVSTYYAHLDKFYVSEGQTIAKGAAIAKMGSTGRSTGPHVHFEVRKNGHPINPLGMY